MCRNLAIRLFLNYRMARIFGDDWSMTLRSITNVRLLSAETFSHVNWPGWSINSNPPRNQLTHIHTYIACKYTIKPDVQTRMHSLPTCHLWKAPGPWACWEIISRASERGNSIAARRKKAFFFNAEKWEAGEELAVAARIIDGNCLGTRLRFMG